MQELQRQELLELVSIAFGFMEEGVLLVDNSGLVVFYNQAASALEGLQPSQVIGRHIDDLYLSESAVSRALHQALLGLSSDDLLLTEFDERGRPVRIQVQCFPLRVRDRQVGVLRLTRDLALWAPELTELRSSTIRQEESRDTLEDGAAVLSGRSSYAAELQEKLQQLQDKCGPVLLWGPPGSGRSSLAKLLHQSSGLQGAILTCDFRFRSATAQEIMLLGVDNALGLWQQAKQGTLILEEVHLASPRLQNRLVTMLAEEDAPRCFLVLPGDPQEAVASGNLHPGLVQRCIAQIALPGLEQRSEDLPQICQYLLRRINHRLQRRIFGLTPLAKDALQSYPWPGGFRELHSVLEGAVMQASGSVITPDLLPDTLHLVNQGLLNPNPVPPAFPMFYDPRRFQAGAFADMQPSPLETTPTSERSQVTLAAAPATEKDPEAPKVNETTTPEEEAVAATDIPFFSPPQHLTEPQVTPAFPEPPAKTQRRRFGEMEKMMIIDALQMNDNDLKAAAKQLRMREATLHKRLEQYGIELRVEN